MKQNTIRLLKGFGSFTKNEIKNFSVGDTILGADANPVELKRWTIEEKEEAKEELAKYPTKYYTIGNIYVATEYALEFCTCDDDGEFIEGSDYMMVG